MAVALGCCWDGWSGAGDACPPGEPPEGAGAAGRPDRGRAGMLGAGCSPSSGPCQLFFLWMLSRSAELLSPALRGG